MENKYKFLFIMFVVWIAVSISLALNVDVPQGSSKSLESLRLVILSLGAYGALATIYLSSVSSLESSGNIQDKIYFDKQENSFEFIKRWNDISLKEARDFTRKILEESHMIAPDDLINRINSKDDLKRSVITEFNFWEEMYLSIECDRVNKDLLKDAFKEAYCMKYNLFKPWLENIEKDYTKTVERLKTLNSKWCHDN